MARVNVFLDDDLLNAVNDEAKRLKKRRSALLQEAARAYLRSKQEEREAEERRRRREDACRRMDDLAKRLGDWDPVGVIRRFRDTSLKGSG